MGTLVSSGIGLTENLRLTERTIRNRSLRENFRSARALVNEGKSLPDAIRKFDFMPAMQLDVLESQLADRDWLVDDFSLADVCYASLVLLLGSVGLEDDLAARPKVAAWAARLTERPSVKATKVF